MSIIPKEEIHVPFVIKLRWHFHVSGKILTPHPHYQCTIACSMQIPIAGNYESWLEKLPVELLYEIQLFALSVSLPIVNERMYGIFNDTHARYRAEYILLRYVTRPPCALSLSPAHTRGELLTHALQYPLCTEAVLDALLRLISPSASSSFCCWRGGTANGSGTDTLIVEGPRALLPKRLFKRLGPRLAACDAPYTSKDEPLPFLRHLYSLSTSHLFRPPNPNAHDGYALSRAVHAGHLHLVKFLLSKGAKPELKDALAVRIAVKKRDLGLVRMLIEREADDTEFGVEVVNAITERCGILNDAGEARENNINNVERSSGLEPETKKKRRRSPKRRRVEDRLEVTTSMLRLAVETDARDIVQYFLDKGARPDLLTIQRMRRIGFV